MIPALLWVAVFFISANGEKCFLSLSIDISNGTHNKDGSIVYDGITFPPEVQFRYLGAQRGCVCQVRSCIRKCCGLGYAMINETCQPLNNTSEYFYFNVYNGDRRTTVGVDNYYLIMGEICGERGYYRLVQQTYTEDTYYIQENGNMYLPYLNDSNGETLTPDRYCLEVFIDDVMDRNLTGLVCFHEERKLADPVYSFGMIISMPFLLLTFLVYAVLPDRNLHGKCLMCYVITLFGAYAFLVFIQLYPNDLAGANCKTLGILCFFFFTVSFFWMNVMSIDIWWAFSGLRGFSGSRKEAERKRFILYCGYAWGVSLLLTTIVIGFTVSENVEKNVWYNPGMGDGQCWFRDGVPTLLYFYVPMATIIVVNITLFAVTACKIKRVQQDTAMLRKDESKKHSYENDKQRFNLYLKLMLAMGVNWAMEIVSWIVDWQIGRVPPPVWYLTDFCNALYGVFVFFIFVFKRNIWKLLKRRYYMIMGKPHLARSMTQTAYSPRTTGSSLNHTVSTDKNFVTDSSVLTSEVS
ncbi:G-protein coupled receptor Mth2-like isoform X2 [Photinus pyralis]|nr:G-protein coupled receptor Mth2-like isoform X2 [Photinus pyralis]